jgi:hypothetical protein
MFVGSNFIAVDHAGERTRAEVLGSALERLLTV